MAFTERTFGGRVPPKGKLDARDQEMVRAIGEAPDRVAALFEKYHFRDGVIEAMNLARAANKYFNDSEPWKTAKSDTARCGTTLNICIQTVRSLAILFAPVIPSMSGAIWKMLNCDGPMEQVHWSSAAQLLLDDDHTLNKPEILVTKIEDKQIEGMVKSLSGDQQPAPAAGGEKQTITIDEFKKIDLRLAKVVSAERVPKSEKLLKLIVEIGGSARQILAGIAKQYEPEKLVGRYVVVVANLQPAKLMGQESNGMLLAANDDEGRISVVTILDELPTGSIVR